MNKISQLSPNALPREFKYRSDEVERLKEIIPSNVIDFDPKLFCYTLGDRIVIHKGGKEGVFVKKILSEIDENYPYRIMDIDYIFHPT